MKIAKFKSEQPLVINFNFQIFQNFYFARIMCKNYLYTPRTIRKELIYAHCEKSEFLLCYGGIKTNELVFICNLQTGCSKKKSVSGFFMRSPCIGSEKENKRRQ